MSLCQCFVKMLLCSGPAGSDDGNMYCVGDGPREGQIVARFRAVGVHAGEKNLSRTQLFCPDGPLHSVKARIDAAAVFVNIPAAVLSSSCVDGQNHALAAEFVRRPADELRLIDGRGIDRNFVRSLS